MKFFIVSCILLSVAYAQEQAPQSNTVLSECFEKDSISCVQTMVRS